MDNRILYYPRGSLFLTSHPNVGACCVDQAPGVYMIHPFPALEPCEIPPVLRHVASEGLEMRKLQYVLDAHTKQVDATLVFHHARSVRTWQLLAKYADQVWPRTPSAVENSSEAAAQQKTLADALAMFDEPCKVHRSFLWRLALVLDLECADAFATECLALSPPISEEDFTKLGKLFPKAEGQAEAPISKLDKATPRRLALARMLLETATKGQEEKEIQGLFDVLDRAQEWGKGDKRSQELFDKHLEPLWTKAQELGASRPVRPVLWVAGVDDGARLKILNVPADVAELCEAIKLKKPNAFKDVDADAIQVFMAKDGKPVGEALAPDVKVDKHGEYMFKSK